MEFPACVPSFDRSRSGGDRNRIESTRSRTDPSNRQRRSIAQSIQPAKKSSWETGTMSKQGEIISQRKRGPHLHAVSSDGLDRGTTYAATHHQTISMQTDRKKEGKGWEMTVRRGKRTYRLSLDAADLLLPSAGPPSLGAAPQC